MVGRLKHKCNTGVNVFIAGSKSIQKERTKVREILSHYQSIKNVRVDTRTFEDFADYVNEDGQQTAYNKFIREKADVVIFVFTEHVGKKTVEEFDVAYDAYKEKQLPQILVFCDGNHIDKSRDAALIKIQEKMNKLGLYYKDYDNYDQLTNEINKNLDIVLGFVNIQAESNIDVHVISQNIAQTTKETIDGKERLVDEYGLLYEITSRFNPYKVSLVGVHPDAKLKDVVIPSQVHLGNEQYTITEIGANAFRECSSLVSIIFPDGILEIGEGAFLGCESLTSVLLSNSITKIGRGAFLHCHNLTSIILSNMINTIEDFTFCGCENLTSITIPNSVKVIGRNSFEGCKNLASIVFSDALKVIADHAFLCCRSLTSIILPKSVKVIGDRAFASCSTEYRGLASVQILGNIDIVGTRIFENCWYLNDLNINGMARNPEGFI